MSTCTLDDVKVGLFHFSTNEGPAQFITLQAAKKGISEAELAGQSVRGDDWLVAADQTKLPAIQAALTS